MRGGALPRDDGGRECQYCRTGTALFDQAHIVQDFIRGTWEIPHPPKSLATYGDSCSSIHLQMLGGGGHAPDPPRMV